MNWQEKFSDEIVPGNMCPCCPSSSISYVDYTGYSWACSFKRHTAQNYVKYLMSKKSYQARIDDLYRRVQAPMPKVDLSQIKKIPERRWEGWGMSLDEWKSYEESRRREKTDKEKAAAGESNEFGKICP